ncbi:MAG: hypothetical protein IJX63_10040 [Lachnospiraceae bacterium]|nr:hypothetical protein [Lachnospiraceae bacterium]
MKRRKGFLEWLDEKIIQARELLILNNAGMGTVEIILIIVVIFTIYKGCK